MKMLKSLYSSFCRAKLQKLQYWWIYPSNAYSESLSRKLTQDNNENVLCKEKTDNLIPVNQNNEIVSENNDASVSAVDKLLPINDTTIDIEKKVVKRKKKNELKLKITPKIKNLQMPKTVLALHVGPNIISWSHLDSNYEVLNLNWYCWCNQMKINSHDLINLVSTITPTLPAAAVYVIEDICIPHKGSKLVQQLLTQGQLAASIMSSILLRDMLVSKSSKPANNVYILQNYFSANWFNLFVGKEVISTEYIMKKILSTTTDKTDKPNVSMRPELKFKYMQLPDADRDQVSWSLLKAISFLCVVELKDIGTVQR